MRLGCPAHGIVTKTVHKTRPGVVGAQGWVSRLVVGKIDSNIGFVFIVYQMDFDKTRLSYSWNIDHNCTQKSARGW